MIKMLNFLDRPTRAGFGRKLFRRKKRQQKREVLVEIERLKNQNETRKLYRNVNETRNGYSKQFLLCKDKSGLVLADEERCIVRWAEYFRELLKTQTIPLTGMIKKKKLT